MIFKQKTAFLVSTLVFFMFFSGACVSQDSPEDATVKKNSSAKNLKSPKNEEDPSVKKSQPDKNNPVVKGAKMNIATFGAG